MPSDDKQLRLEIAEEVRHYYREAFPSADFVEYRIHGELANTDVVMNGTFWLGCYSGLADLQSDYVIDSINQFISAKQ